MNVSITSQQNKFEKKICQILGFTKHISQSTEHQTQMVIDHLTDDELFLSGTIATKEKADGTTDFLLIVTKDSEVNHIEEISLKMIRRLIESYTSIDAHTKKRNKIVLASNIPAELHSQEARVLAEKYNFTYKSIGYSFCENHKIEYAEMY